MQPVKAPFREASHGIVRARFRRPGFSLVELMVVVAIIVVLMALLVPGLRRAKDYSKRETCAAHLHGLANTAQTFETDNDGVTPTSIASLAGLLGVGTNTTSDYIYEVERCPVTITDPFYGAPIGLPYMFYPFGQGGKYSAIVKPSGVVAMGDEGYLQASYATTPPTYRMNVASGGYFMSTTSAINNGTPDFDGLHAGSGNIAWYDGHVSSEIPFVPTQIPTSLSKTVTSMPLYNYGYLVPIPGGTTYAQFTNTSVYSQAFLNQYFTFTQ